MKDKLIPIDKLGWPVEFIIGKPITNIIRFLLHTRSLKRESKLNKPLVWIDLADTAKALHTEDSAQWEDKQPAGISGTSEGHRAKRISQ